MEFAYKIKGQDSYLMVGFENFETVSSESLKKHAIWPLSIYKLAFCSTNYLSKLVCVAELF